MDLATEARQFLHSTRHGILSTHSLKFDGYPFGSVTPFVLDHHCQPIILISSIAEHTKNILSNPKVSLLVFAPFSSKSGDDLQANARLTLIGEAQNVGKDDADLMARYCRYFPESADYFAMHDFSFYRIHIAQARYIAGFGKMGWVNGNAISNSDLKAPNSAIATLETGMITHMNADHNDSLLAYCHHFHGVAAIKASLVGVDSEGFDIAATTADNIKILRFNFEAPIFDANSARAAFIAFSKTANAS